MTTCTVRHVDIPFHRLRHQVDTGLLGHSRQELVLLRADYEPLSPDLLQLSVSAHFLGIRWTPLSTAQDKAQFSSSSSSSSSSSTSSSTLSFIISRSTRYIVTITESCSICFVILSLLIAYLENGSEKQFLWYDILASPNSRRPLSWVVSRAPYVQNTYLVKPPKSYFNEAIFQNIK